MRKDAGNLGFVSVGGRYVRFTAERECYHRIYIKAVVIGSYVRVGKIVRLSVSSVFYKMRILCGKFLKRLGVGELDL